MERSDFSRPSMRFGSSPSHRGPGSAQRPGAEVRSPRFRRDPFVRDVAFDPGRATAPCIAAPHMLPSTLKTASAPATLSISWLNPTPHTIAVYASRPASPTAPQHSLAGGRYPLPAPDFHRLDHASFAWRTIEALARPDPVRLTRGVYRRRPQAAIDRFLDDRNV